MKFIRKYYYYIDNKIKYVKSLNIIILFILKYFIKDIYKIRDIWILVINMFFVYFFLIIIGMFRILCFLLLFLF